jgi:hypothetical protein
MVVYNKNGDRIGVVITLKPTISLALIRTVIKGRKNWQGIDAMHVNINICQLINELIKF